eukprot:2554280-Lingulodinium_polyedra.AAC.1
MCFTVECTRVRTMGCAVGSPAVYSGVSKGVSNGLSCAIYSRRSCGVYSGPSRGVYNSLYCGVERGLLLVTVSLQWSLQGIHSWYTTGAIVGSTLSLQYTAQ